MRRLIPAVLVVVLLGLVVWWRCASTTSPSPSADHPSKRNPLTATQRRDQALGDRKSLRGWRAQTGIGDRRIAGRVTFDGVPYRDAQVSLRWSATDTFSVPPPTVSTDSSGRFDLGAWFADVYTVTASAPGKTAAIVVVDLRDPQRAPAPDALELALTDCTNTLVGTVVDGSGGPIVGAQIIRERSTGTESQSDGSYKLCLPRGWHAVQVSADGYGAIVLVVEARGQLWRDAVLVPASTIRGRVVRKRDKTPVAGAMVAAWPDEGGPVHARQAMIETDAEGRFELAGFAPGRFTLWATTDLLVGEVTTIADPGKTTEVEIHVTDCARVHGRVVSNGAPVSGATVKALGSRTAISQQDGSFVLEEVPFGRIELTAMPYAVKSPRAITIDREEVRDVILDVAAMASISGKVTRGGAPVPGARVTTGSTIAEADASGTFRLAGLSAGRHRVFADAPHVGAAKPVDVGPLADGEHRADVVLELSLQGSIAGTVVDQSGQPLRDVAVAWVSATTKELGRGMTDDLGRYDIEGLSGDTYQAQVETREPHKALAIIGGNTAVKLDSAKPRAEGVRLQVQVNRRSIGGTVTDGGAPVPDAQVDALLRVGDGAPRFPTWMRFPTTSTTAQGAFQIDQLDAGTYAVRARTADGREGIVPVVEAGARDVAIQIQKAGSIDVTLVGYATVPKVEAQNLTTDQRTYLGRGSDKQVRIEHLPPGRYLVTAQNGIESDATQVDVASDKTVTLTLTSRGTASLSGTVHEFEGDRPVAGMACLAYPSAGAMQAPTTAELSRAPRTDAQGQFVIDPTPAGAIVAYCYDVETFELSTARAFVTLTAGTRGTARLTAVRRIKPGLGGIGVELDSRAAPVAISNVLSGGAAERAGIRAGDQLLALDGRTVENLTAKGVRFLIAGAAVGSKLAVTLRRNGEQRTVNVPVVRETAR